MTRREKQKLFALFGDTTITIVTVANTARENTFAHDRTRTPWLSILVPVYNVRPYVEECLFSILSQIVPDAGIELILLDDKSTDGSDELCERMIAGIDVNVRIIRHDQNRGMSAARNSMLEAATGEYVWFIDADDKILDGSIKRLREIVEASCADVIMCDYVREAQTLFSTFAGPNWVLTGCTETLVAGLFSQRRMHVWSRVWKRALFCNATRFPEGAWFEDISTIPRLMLKANSFYYAAEPWVFYRSRPDSIMAQMQTRNFNTSRHDDLARALSGFCGELKRAIPDARDETLMAIARFQAREFVKITKRLVRARGSQPSWPVLRREAGRYRQLMETDSPVPFASVAGYYARKGKIVRAVALWAALSLAASDGTRE